MAGRTVFMLKDETQLREVDRFPEYPWQPGMKIEFDDRDGMYEVVECKVWVADEPVLFVIVTSPELPVSIW